MIKIRVWNIETETFNEEEFCITAPKFEVAAEAYCDHVGTKIKVREGSAFVLENNTIITVDKIRKNKVWGFTKIRKAA